MKMQMRNNQPSNANCCQSARIFNDHQGEYIETLKRNGYAGCSIRRVTFAFAEFERFCKSALEDGENPFSAKTIEKFAEWKIQLRKKRKYHASYRGRVSVKVLLFFDWYFQNSNRTRINKIHLIEMSRSYVKEIPFRFPRWEIEQLNKLREFFNYLEKKSIFDLRKISLATVDDFIKSTERQFYSRRNQYNALYKSGLQISLKEYFLYLSSKGVVAFKDPEIDSPTPKTLLDDVLPPYLDFCAQARGLVPSSVDTVNRILQRFAKVLEDESVSEIASINIGHLDLFRGKFKRAQSSMICDNAILRRFLKWLYLEGHIRSDISKLIISRRTYAQSKVPDFLSDDELTRLLDFDREFKSKNDLLTRSIFQLLLFTGLRVGEAAKLELDDVHWDDERMVIKHRKNGSDLLQPLPKQVIDCLHTYISLGRPKSTISRRIFFTVTAPIRPVTPTGLSATVLRYFEKKGIRGGAHRLRHTFAQRLLDSGSSLEEVQSLLGQHSINSTRIYAKTSMVRMRKFVVGDEN